MIQQRVNKIPGLRPGKDTRGRTVQFEKDGNLDSFKKTIEDLDGVVNMRVGKTKDGVPAVMGTLKNGDKFIGRMSSSDGRPTLEFQLKEAIGPKDKIKIRFEEVKGP